MSTGKTIRIARLLERRAFCLAFDHGLQLGPIDGLRDPQAVFADALATDVDGIIVTPGLLRRYAEVFAGRNRPVAILRLDQTTMWRIGGTLGYAEGHSRTVATVEDAVELGADAVITYYFIGHDDPELETRSVEACAAVAAAARRRGVVHIAEPMAARNGLAEDVFAPAVVAMHTRMAAEIGADILKTDWTGDAASFRDVVTAAEAPVVVAGGASLGDDSRTLAMVAEVLDSGAAGILFGRNIFQARARKPLMQALQAMIHEGAGLEQARRLLGTA